MNHTKLIVHWLGVAVAALGVASVAAACGGDDAGEELVAADAGEPSPDASGADTTVPFPPDAGPGDAGPDVSCTGLAIASVLVGAPGGADAGASDAGDAGDAGATSPGLCASGGTLTITGTGFMAGASVTAGTRTATNVTVSSDGKQAIATFAAGAPDSPVEVRLTNPTGCSTKAATALGVIGGPLVVFVDPPTVWNGMDTPVAVFGANVTPAVVSVAIVPAGLAAPVTSLSFTPAPGRPERPVAIVPKAMAAGMYDLRLTDASGCPAVLTNALRVTATTTLVINGISPDFGWTGASTPVTLSASATAPSPGFDAFPRTYLVPSGGSSTIYPMDAMTVVSPTSLTGAVPAGLPAGKYDVVVVNESGAVGVKPSAFTVTTAQPPVIDSVTPEQIANTVASQAVIIRGKRFGAGAPTVVFKCIRGDGTAYPDQTLPVVTSTDTRVDATLDATLYAAANCLVRITRADDSVVAEFATVPIVTPATNLTGFLAGGAIPQMAVARESLGAASGSVSQASRFVYAIAGDDGAVGLDTIEVLPVDIYGRPGPAFFTQRNKLAATRTQTSAVRVGRFLYVVGGAMGPNMAAGAVNTVERAAILDNTTSPTNLGLDLDVSKAAGLAPGVYYYRVAAVMSAADPFNPSGETLPSAPIAFRLPTLPAGYGARPKLSWDPVTGAVGYRIYRTAANGAPLSDKLIADTRTLPAAVTCPTATSCIDSGAALTLETPLLPGSTGTWTKTKPMGRARQGAAVTWAADPADGTKAYVYVFGGRDATGAVVNDYEYLTITVDNTTGAQDASVGFTSGGINVLGAPRWRHRAWTVTPKETSLWTLGTYVWVGGGATATNTMVNNIDGAQVQAGGALTAFANAGTVNTASAGYGACAGGDLLFTFGGQNGQPSVQTQSAELTATPPTLGQIQSFTPGLQNQRVDMAAAVQSGYFYVLGGRTPAGVTKTIEYVLY